MVDEYADDTQDPGDEVIFTKDSNVAQWLSVCLAYTRILWFKSQYKKKKKRKKIANWGHEND
jgi:hypothetical protein